MRLTRVGEVLVILLVWYAAWSLVDTYTEDLSLTARRQLYGGILLAAVLVICFFPHVLDKF